jgi:glutamate N-acetyltransferase / amino-acid N-acetyltransferase
MHVTLPAGFRAGGIRCGLKKRPELLDLGLLLADKSLPAWALFTRNRLNGAHIPVCRDHLDRSGGLVRAVLVNAGNANCATGPEGVEDARVLCAALAERIGCPTEQVLMISTGVIGARLDAERVERALDPLLEEVGPDGAEAFARAIMTTDTYPKAHSRETTAGLVTGFAKGSGMIHPDMATMLAFLLGDRVPEGGLDAVRRIADRSFHRTTVDGDTSPNDTLLLWGRTRGVHPQQPRSDEGGSEGGAAGTVPPGDVERAYTEVAQTLARDIARDGEGATRLITIRVRDAADEQEATRIGRAVAISPLVKTAIAGRDPNWGRIVSAASSCGIPVEPAHMRLAIGDVDVYADGRPLVANEAAAHEHLVSREEVFITLHLGRGRAEADVWTCDLTADYVDINANYRS